MTDDSDESFAAVCVEHDLESIQASQAIKRGDLGDAIKHRERMAVLHAETVRIAEANLASMASGPMTVTEIVWRQRKAGYR